MPFMKPSCPMCGRKDHRYYPTGWRTEFMPFKMPVLSSLGLIPLALITGAGLEHLPGQAVLMMEKAGEIWEGNHLFTGTLKIAGFGLIVLAFAGSFGAAYIALMGACLYFSFLGWITYFEARGREVVMPIELCEMHPDMEQYPTDYLFYFVSESDDMKRANQAKGILRKRGAL